jgi:medium-chain acyl-[acyl-carrier-protein] hydrolase
VIELRTLSPPPAARPTTRLLCLPYAGGSPSVFARWPAALPPDVVVQSVLLPGREALVLAAPVTTVERYVEELELVLGRVGQDLPLVVFGHSLGALVGYELTWRRWRAGRPLPKQLVLSGHGAAWIPSRRPPVAHLPAPEFLAAIAELGGIPAELLSDQELMALLLPGLRADVRMSEEYLPPLRAALPVPILALTGDLDPDVTPDDTAAWAAATSAGFELRVLPGGHFFLHDARAEVLDLLAGVLAAGRPVGR